MKTLLTGLFYLCLVGCGKSSSDVENPSDSEKAEGKAKGEFEKTKTLAEQGDAEAQCNLALLYGRGEGVKQDYKEAVKWLRKAAEQGDPEHQYSLGSVYYNGEGVEQDAKEALKWCRKAAEQGHPEARCWGIL